jgi:hypothetical protein
MKCPLFTSFLVAASFTSAYAIDKCEGLFTFPDLGMMMAESKGIKRPTKSPLTPLPTFDTNSSSLPPQVVFQIIYKMASFENWKEVAYRASGHRTIEDKLRASWARDDERADLNEYMSQLNEEQRKIINAAFDGGLAARPSDTKTPNQITLEWIKTHFPASSK